MSEKPEALRLAHELDAYHTRSSHKEAAKELRRLHADNERLNGLLAKVNELAWSHSPDALHELRNAIDAAMKGDKT